MERWDQDADAQRPTTTSTGPTCVDTNATWTDTAGFNCSMYNRVRKRGAPRTTMHMSDNIEGPLAKINYGRPDSGDQLSWS